jgi:transposase
MGRPSVCSPEEKKRIVLAVLTRRKTVTQAADEIGVSRTTIGNWKRQFIDAGREGLADGLSAHTLANLEQLRAENAELALQLHETHLLLQVWKMSAQALAKTLDPETVPREAWSRRAD